MAKYKKLKSLLVFDRLVFCFFMSLFMSFVMSLVVKFYVQGFYANFFHDWIRIFPVSFVTAFFVSYTLQPLVFRLTQMVIKRRQAKSVLIKN
ncbi:MAG: DUF2798 domain-containing protein [Alphaproteobacteria bacterium]|jgi:hypothetical protein|nr:DUF2798 domain-containing protein [Alphaproteobacteria bacterium]MBP9878341.1 DUF2798 domain-containing protein [Alphaproteobacteria bacterium]